MTEQKLHIDLDRILQSKLLAVEHVTNERTMFNRTMEYILGMGCIGVQKSGLCRFELTVHEKDKYLDTSLELELSDLTNRDSDVWNKMIEFMKKHVTYESTFHIFPLCLQTFTYMDMYPEDTNESPAELLELCESNDNVFIDIFKSIYSQKITDKFSINELTVREFWSSTLQTLYKRR